MAGILDILNMSEPGGFSGYGGGGILGSAAQSQPGTPPPSSWLTKLGIFGAGLSDAGAALNGRDTNNIGQFQSMLRQNQLRQAYQTAATTSDPAARQQAYGMILANGGDPTALQNNQANAAYPQLMQNMQPMSVAVTPAVNSTNPAAAAQRTAAQQINASPNLQVAPTLQQATALTGVPELSQKIDPMLLQGQVAAATKAAEPYELSPGQHRFIGGQDVASVPLNPTPNQPFNPDGTPNKAFQDYTRANMAAQQAPAWARVGLEKQKLTDAESGKLEPAVLGFMAQQVLAGDKSPFQNLGRGQQGAQNITALRQEVMKQAQSRGLGGADLAALNAEFSGLQAGERTLGTRTANVEMAASETQNLIPMALAASKAVPRSQYPSLNKIQLAVQQGTGDENVVRLNVAVNGLVNTYARAISPSGTPTVSDKDHAREILDKAWSNGQFEAGVDQMNKEIAAARKSPGSVRGEFRSAISGRAGGSAAVPDAIGAAPSPQSLPRIAKPGQTKTGVKFQILGQ